jgi:hypothetical protein
MGSSETPKLAERIARILETEPQSPEIASIYATLEKINHRLDKIEQVMTAAQPTPTNYLRAHPSLDKLSIAEAIADEIFAGIEKEKACQFEPGKPCDHCSMCNSRGF